MKMLSVVLSVIHLMLGPNLLMVVVKLAQPLTVFLRVLQLAKCVAK